jgi:putative tropomyosin alpha-3 chain
MVRTMENKPAEIVAEVFRHSGTRLTEDDPIVVMLMMQDQSFRQAFDAFARQQTEERLVFLEELSVREGNITAAAAKLEKYREQLLAELAQYANGQIAEAEQKIYGSVSQRIARDTEEANERLVKRLERLVVCTMAAALAVLLIVGWVIWRGG